MKAREFDAGEDVADEVDRSRARRQGVTRRSVIKLWIAERLG